VGKQTDEPYDNDLDYEIHDTDVRCVSCNHSNLYNDYMVHLECPTCGKAVCEMCVDEERHAC
jgi:predicted RNA-binding Zn-ribbon protein involved in translation (DUF1610 family)